MTKTGSNLEFLNGLEPIPKDCALFRTPLLEKCIYGHLRPFEKFGPEILLPQEGARRILDIVYALRQEIDTPISIREMKFQLDLFGIYLPPSLHGELVVRSTGLSYLKISDISRRWSRMFWLDMRDIHRIGGDAPSNLGLDWAGIGNLDVQVYLLENAGRAEGSTCCSHTMTGVPILGLETLKLISRGVIPWHGVDPVKDGRLGAAGYLVREGEHKARFGALDVFVPNADSFARGHRTEGLVIAYMLADLPAKESFEEVMARAWDADSSDFVQRALADIKITFTALNPADRVFHNEPGCSLEKATAILQRNGIELKAMPTGEYIFEKEGKVLNDGPLPLERTGENRDLFLAKFMDNLIHPLRSRPFPERRFIIMNVDMDALREFVPVREGSSFA